MIDFFEYLKNSSPNKTKKIPFDPNAGLYSSICSIFFVQHFCINNTKNYGNER